MEERRQFCSALIQRDGSPLRDCTEGSSTTILRQAYAAHSPDRSRAVLTGQSNRGGATARVVRNCVLSLAACSDSSHLNNQAPRRAARGVHQVRGAAVPPWASLWRLVADEASVRHLQRQNRISMESDECTSQNSTCSDFLCRGPAHLENKGLNHPVSALIILVLVRDRLGPREVHLRSSGRE